MPCNWVTRDASHPAMPHESGKIIITGTGRAGTTFLVRLLTELGLDTGFTPANWREHFHAHCAAGLEKDLEAPSAPRIVKDPDLCERLPAIVAEGRVTIAHALVPVRELAAATASRIRVGADAPGGLVGTDAAERQRAVLAERFHRLVEALVQHEIPHTFLAFPRFARDARYCYERIRFLLGAVTFEEFELVFSRVADPALIHDFKRPATDIGMPARAFAAERQRRRRARRMRRALALAAGLAILLAALGLTRPVWRARTTTLRDAGLQSAAAVAAMEKDARLLAVAKVWDADGDGRLSAEEIRIALGRRADVRRSGFSE